MIQSPPGAQGAPQAVADTAIQVAVSPLRVASALLGAAQQLVSRAGQAPGERARTTGRRHVSSSSHATMVQVRGLGQADGDKAAEAVQKRLEGCPGVEWAVVDANTGHVHVGHDRSVTGVADVVGTVESVEREWDLADGDYAKLPPHPSEGAPVAVAAAELAADMVALASASLLPRRLQMSPTVARISAAGVRLVDNQPRVRAAIERQIGLTTADLVITLASAGVHGLQQARSTLSVDAAQRLALLGEALARRASWRVWEPLLYGPHTEALFGLPLAPGRPVPVPGGPVERYASQAAAGSLVAAAIGVASGRGIANSAEMVVVGAPRATRTGREVFAGTLGLLLGRRGVLPLDPSAWRLLDRATVVVVDARALHGGRPLVLDAVSSQDDWSEAHVWSAAQRLLWDESGRGRLPIPPPRGRSAEQLRLQPPEGGSGPAGPVHAWRVLTDSGAEVGRVLVGVELDPLADGLLARARASGLRVVLAADPSSSELRSRAHESIESGDSVAAEVTELQRRGEVVLVVATDDHVALRAADIGVSVARPAESVPGERMGGGALRASSGADVVVDGLEAATRVVEAAAEARRVSELSRTLALSGSSLGALLMVAGPRPGAGPGAATPVSAAAAVAGAVGARAALRVAQKPLPPSSSLVPWHALEPDEVLARLAVPASDDGTSTTGVLQAALALAANEMGGPLVRGLGAARDLLVQMRRELADPLTPVLSVGAAASAILGSPTDAALVGGVMAVNAVVSAAQRLSAERALRGLVMNEELSARVVVGDAARQLGPLEDAERLDVRDVPAHALRPGDVVLLRQGEVVPADARLIEAHNLEADESSLTGESVTVDKQVASTPGAALGDRSSMLYQGTIVSAGWGRAVVVAAGAATQAGRALAAAAGPPTGAGVQARLQELTSKALPVTLAGGAGVMALAKLRGQTLRDSVAAGVSVAVAAVPEGLPLVATVAQLAAARRLSGRGVLVRSSRTVEALGRIDVVCFDKTGTLTQNRLRLTHVGDLAGTWAADDVGDHPMASRILRVAARACPDPGEGPVVHATDRAVIEAAQTRLPPGQLGEWDPVEEVSFDSSRGYAATLGHTAHHLRLAVKGAPEVLIPRCTRALQADGELVPMDDSRRRMGQDRVHLLASEGLRVLAVARRDLAEEPDDLEGAVSELTLIGFVALADTPRPEAAAVVARLAESDIGVVMITGDHPVTAAAIARSLGLSHSGIVTGADLVGLGESERSERVRGASVFARITPEQKVQVIQALQQDGRVVAMMGDGANDAAAIRLADVGIALAAHGSAVARNASDLVLTRPDTSLLLEAIAEGRAMWHRVANAVAVLVGGNAGEVAFTLAGTAISGRAPVGTRQFLLVNLFTDMFPAMAIALADPAPVVRSPGSGAPPGAGPAWYPRPNLGQTLNRAIAVRGSATTVGATGAWVAARLTGGDRRASTIGLVALVGTQLGQTLVVGGRSPLVIGTVAGSAAALAAVVQVPGLSQFFGCTPLGPLGWATAISSAAAATAGSVVLGKVPPSGVPRELLPPAG